MAYIWDSRDGLDVSRGRVNPDSLLGLQAPWFSAGSRSARPTPPALLNSCSRPSSPVIPDCFRQGGDPRSGRSDAFLLLTAGVLEVSGLSPAPTASGGTDPRHPLVCSSRGLRDILLLSLLLEPAGTARSELLVTTMSPRSASIILRGWRSLSAAPSRASVDLLP